MKKIGLIWSLLLAITVCSYGQMPDMSKRFEEFKKQQNQRFDTFKVSQQAKFDAFRKEQNEKYAEFMKNSWEMFDALPPVVPEEEKKVEPVVYVEPKPAEPKKEEPKVDPKPAEPKKEEPKVEPKPAEPKKEEPKVEPKKEDKPIPVKKEVIVVPKPQPKPEPIAPVEPKEEIPHKIVSVSFYGTLVSVGFPTSDNLKIKALNENALSDAWMQLSDEKYDITLNNVLKVRDNMDLCDWGYIHMLQAITEKQYGKTNEAVLMQAFLLAQSNYKVRLAFGEGKLFVLVASQYSILGMSRYQLDGEYFYPLNCNIKKLNICKAAFDNEKSISLQLRKEQKLDNLIDNLKNNIHKVTIKLKEQSELREMMNKLMKGEKIEEKKKGSRFFYDK